uniref:Uncharacterized protein n=1 Tax=Anguilla anguilla TaxID=7936 RepID=A0A0E9T7N6_ANGAN
MSRGSLSCRQIREFKDCTTNLPIVPQPDRSLLNW